MRVFSAMAMVVVGLLAGSGVVHAQSPADQAVAGDVVDLTWIGFEQYRDVSRLVVRTTERAPYRILAERPDVVEIVLENTRISLKNNARFLDTRYFDSPVRLVVPKEIEGPSPSVRIEVYLRQRVPYREVNRDNVLAVDFSR